MKRRIYINFIGIILLCVLLLSVLVSLVFYSATENQEISAIKDSAGLVADMLNKGIRFGGEEAESARFADYIGGGDSTRMTIIAPNGDVLLDNKADASTLENHSGREEFKQALETGSGEAMRFSSTMGGITYYYAVRLSGGNVLRISKARSSIDDSFAAFLPTIVIATAFILLLAHFVAKRLTDRIVRPINELDFESESGFVYDELLPFLKKIGQQKREITRQIATLQNRADTIEAITGNMKEGLILIDPNGAVLSANKSVLGIFHESDIAGKSILHVCREITFQQGIKQCLAGKNLEMPFERDGKIYSIYFSPVYSENRISGAVILFFDTTERYKAEKQRREFSANVSHELKTPLTTISALSEMIGNGMAKEEDVEGFAKKITGQAKRLINIIEDLIKLSELDEGDVQQEKTVFDIRELADSVITSLQEQAKEKQVQVRLLGERTQVCANMRLLDELIYNLVDNGIKYNKEGGEVNVTLSAAGDFCKISVADTGIGIPREHQERVFERFYRVDKSRSKKTGGTGLGLSIVKHVVERHKGRIELTSGEGGGTRIDCYIGGVISP